MLILGIDTSSVETNISLMEKGSITARARRRPDKTHSREVLSILRGLLDDQGVKPESVDIVAVACGPGSFTGLRIGMGTALGLGDALDVPVMGVGTLDAMARSAPLWDGGYIIPALNARRGEVYAAFYAFEQGRLKKITGDLAESPETIAGMIDKPARFIGDGFKQYAEIFMERASAFIDDAVESPEQAVSEGVARIAWEEAAAGRIARNPPVPRYVRRSQAEINWERLHAR